VAQFVVKFGLVFQKKPGYIDVPRDIFLLASCWSFLRAFFEIFGIQVYFLWILQTQKRTVLVNKKNTIIFAPTTIILGTALLFVGTIYLSLNVNVDRSEQRVKDPSEILQSFLNTNWGLADLFLRISIQYLAFPF
jgi:hypothetical protein